MKFANESRLGAGEFYKVSLFATGIKKRCRKVDRHLIDMGYTEFKTALTDEDKASLKKAAQTTIGVTMKSLYNDQAYLALNRVTRQANHDEKLGTWYMESWQPFHELNQRIEVCS